MFNVIGKDFIDYVNSNFNPLPDNPSDIFVVWSGGCDSTALVLYLWEKYHKQINLISIEYERFGSNFWDIKAQNKLLKIFKNKNIDVNHCIISIKETGNYNDYASKGLVQPQVFLSAVSHLFRAENRLICFGYIRTDDFWHFSKHFYDIIDSMNRLSCSTSIVSIPFEFVTKEQILWYLHEHNILKYCNYCQYPEQQTGKVCKECVSCIMHEQALKRCKNKHWNFYNL